MPDEAERQMEVLLALEPEPDADPEEIERLGRQLRAALRELDVEDVAAVTDGAVPAGAKGEAVSLAQWLVTLSATGGVFATVVATLKDWLNRRAGAHKITITIDGDSLELERATPAERAELIDTFVRRHEPD
ncbi:MAG: effector-associated constant component EACC1 [Nocardioidaceae bacterium]